MSFDLLLYETGDGGDLQLLGNDLANTSGLFNMVYMALFGGNPQAVTTDNEIETEQRLDWIGNSVLFGNKEDIQFNSFTERALLENALNSDGRLKIEDAAKKDLNFLANFADIEVSVSVLSDNKAGIYVKLQEPDNLQEKEFEIIWDSLRGEAIENKTI